MDETPSKPSELSFVKCAAEELPELTVFYRWVKALLRCQFDDPVSCWCHSTHLSRYF